MYNSIAFYATCTIILIILLYLYGTRNFNHFKKSKVKYLKPVPFLGNIVGSFFEKQHFLKIMDRVYKAFPDQKYVGFFEFNNPSIWIRDPSLIKQIAVKDFDHFTDHKSIASENLDPLFNNGLFALKGQKWKDMRTTLSPAFTSSKIKSMFPLLLESSEQLNDYILNELKSSLVVGQEFTEIETKELFTRYANDVIANCAFGIKVNSLKDNENDFFKMVKKITDMSFWFIVKFFVYILIPKIMKFFKVSLMGEEVANFFRNIVQKTMELRESRNIVRPDMIHLLMQAKKGMLKDDEIPSENCNNILPKQMWSDDELTSQVFAFFLAGFETVSTLLSYAIYEISTRPDIQKKLNEEIDEVMKSESNISYEMIMKMKYLDMFISETLRYWPPVFGVDRICVKSYNLPSSVDNEDTLSNFKVNVGDTIYFPIRPIHMDPKYYVDPENFDPDRFSEENKTSIDAFTYLPFGAGPRICIGSRFAMIEVKAAIIQLLSTFEFTSCDKTVDPLKSPMKMSSIIPENGMWVKVKFKSENKI